MLYLAIPAHNEVATIGVLLWRLRTVLAEFPREYEVVVYDDASTDETADVAEQYQSAMPVTVIRGATSVGYAGAVDALVRHIAAATRYPRRDAMLLLQGDFTDPPGIVPEFARRFEGGADVVVGERSTVTDAPVPVRRLFSAARLSLRPFVRVDGVRDLTGSMRLVRISVLRDLLRVAGDAPVCEGDSWTANADLLLRLVPHARRVESVPVEPTYGVRMRETRRVTVRDALASLRWGWRARGRRAVPTTMPEAAAAADTVRPGARPRPPRREDTELTAERVRERMGERSNSERSNSERNNGERARPPRTREPREDSPRESVPRENASRDNATRDNGTREPARKPREPREPRETREPRAPRVRPDIPLPAAATAAPLPLDDPFSPPRREVPSFDRVLGRAAPRASDTASTSPADDTPDMLVQHTSTVVNRADTAPLDDAGSDADAGDVETGDGTTDLADTGERKRRRNRRSRRKRPRTDGAEGVEGSEGADGIDGAAVVDAADSNGTFDSSATDREASVGGSDGTDDAEIAEDGELSASEEARTRRRGRRGRRGGARRSRGRTQAGGDEGGGGEDLGGGNDAGDAAPTPVPTPSPYAE